MFFVGLLAISALNFLKISTAETIANFSLNDLRNILFDEIPPKDVSESSDDIDIVKFLLDFAVKCNNINKNRASLLIKDSFELIFDLKNSKRIEIIFLDHSKKEIMRFKTELTQKK